MDPTGSPFGHGYGEHVTSTAARVLWLSNETPDRHGQGGQRRQYFQIAALVAAGALLREESRGGHFRTDFPETSDRWEHHTEMTLEQALELRAKA